MERRDRMQVGEIRRLIGVRQSGYRLKLAVGRFKDFTVYKFGTLAKCKRAAIQFKKDNNAISS